MATFELTDTMRHRHIGFICSQPASQPKAISIVYRLFPLCTNTLALQKKNICGGV